jgi:hypothetical protein
MWTILVVAVSAILLLLVRIIVPETPSSNIRTRGYHVYKSIMGSLV